MAIRIYRIVQNVIVIAAAVILMALAGMISFLDINPCVVVSGSMEPEIPTGSLCFIDCQQKDPDIGDIICYKTEDLSITHRVVGVTDSGYITKGDSNDSADPGIVKQSQIFGTYLFDIPKLGYAVMFLKSVEGIVAALIGVLCFAILGYVLSRKQ